MTSISILRSCMNYMIAFACVYLATTTLNWLFNASVELHETAAFAALAFAVRNK